jgi:aspartate aminotransferase
MTFLTSNNFDETMKFSDRLLRMKPSATRASADRVAELKAQGKRIISFTVGEPDFPSPQAAYDAANDAMKIGATHYTATQGTMDLRKAIIDYYKDRYGIDYSPKEICVGSGAKSLLFEAFGVLVNPDDEVVIPIPAWVSYFEQVDVFDGKCVRVDTTNENFKPSLETIERAITPRTVALVVNSPQNPTGIMYSREFMAGLCRMAMEHDFVLVNDEIYERLTYGSRYVNPLTDVPEAREHVLTINGASKAYAMTGWRLGFALGSTELIAKMATLQGHITSSASSISQWAVAGAIRNAQDDVESMRAEYAKRMEYVYSELSSMPHIRVNKPKGAFYFFIDVRPCIGKNSKGIAIGDDQAFCTALLDYGVALVPGVAFLTPGFARLSYACSMDELKEGLGYLRAFLDDLC